MTCWYFLPSTQFYLSLTQLAEHLAGSWPRQGSFGLRRAGCLRQLLSGSWDLACQAAEPAKNRVKPGFSPDALSASELCACLPWPPQAPSTPRLLTGAVPTMEAQSTRPDIPCRAPGGQGQASWLQSILSTVRRRVPRLPFIEQIFIESSTRQGFWLQTTETHST